MANAASVHLSEEQLAAIQDGDGSARDLSHLESCPLCHSRLEDLSAGVAAYAEFRDSIRSGATAPAPWTSLDRLVAQHEWDKRRRNLRWGYAAALAAAACIVLAVSVLYRPGESGSAKATELLADSAELALPEDRYLSVRAHGRTLVRPAVLRSDADSGGAQLEDLRLAFIAARYSWRDPLNARSFQAWRATLSKKRDSVTMISEGEAAYRVRTESPSGALRSASLTLRARDLRPTGGAFQFEGQESLEMEESPAAPAAPAPRLPSPPAGQPPREVPAGPADVLRVLAALNEIGADAGEPIEVSSDRQQGKVVVRAQGLSLERRGQVAQAVQSLPRVIIDFQSALADAPAVRDAAPERLASNIPAGQRRELESRFGGAFPLQQATDRALDASGALLSRAHAMATLARQFPPAVEADLAPSDRELLRTLRRRHLAEAARLEAQLRAELKPLAPPAGASEAQPIGSWQAGADALVASAQALDGTLNRLLAGSYAQSEAEGLTRTAGSDLQHLRAALQAQREDAR